VRVEVVVEGAEGVEVEEEEEEWEMTWSSKAILNE